MSVKTIWWPTSAFGRYDTKYTLFNAHTTTSFNVHSVADNAIVVPIPSLSQSNMSFPFPFLPDVFIPIPSHFHFQSARKREYLFTIAVVGQKGTVPINAGNARDQKVRNTALIFDPSHICVVRVSKQSNILNLKHIYYATVIDPCPPQIWCISAHAHLRSGLQNGAR